MYIPKMTCRDSVVRLVVVVELHNTELSKDGAVQYRASSTGTPPIFWIYKCNKALVTTPTAEVYRGGLGKVNHKRQDPKPCVVIQDRRDTTDGEASREQDFPMSERCLIYI